MNRAIVALCCLVVLGGLFWLFPLFQVVRIGEAGATLAEETLDVAAFADTFWTKDLIPSLARAPEATEFLLALRENQQDARKRFGRKVGVSRTTMFVMKGSGRVVTIEKRGIGISLTGNGSEPDIVLQTGLLFGNTVRDATGLLDASTFADSRQFNDISAKLNSLVESRIATQLKEKAVVGKDITFAGCAEMQDDTAIIRPIAIIPLEFEVK